MASHAEPRDHELGRAERLTVEGLVRSRSPTQLLTLPSEADPVKNFQVLIDNKILSAPVVTKDGNCLGFLDVRDMVSAVVFASREEEKKRHLQIPQSDCFEPDKLSAALRDYASKFEARAMADPTAALTTSYLCQRHQVHFVSMSDPLQSVLAKLIEFDVRRVVIKDDKGGMMGLISQSDIIRYLSDHTDQFPLLFEKTVTEAKVGTSPVITCKTSDKVATAFKHMDDQKIGGLAVVDDAGAIVTNISASDIKLFLSVENRDALLQTSVIDFVSKVRSDPKEADKTVFPYVVVRTNDNLASVVRKLATTRFHHLYVIDDKQHPVMVISLRDCIKAVRAWMSLA